MMDDGRRPPFVVDYFHDGRCFCVILEAPANWADAERHLRSLKLNAEIVGSDAEEHSTNVLTLWIDGLAVWLKTAWRNWRRA
jgi:hypothetical protein